jgi:fatty acid desaturase
MTTNLTVPPRLSLSSPEVQRRVNALRGTDNRTNWYYLAREYLFLATVVGLAVAFYHYRAIWGLSWVWDVAVTLVAGILVGVGQSRISALGHEGSHYVLFRHRLLNELASDWLCLFPLWSLTHYYRLQHLAHHLYPNDPERDPEVIQMKASGHHFEFPVSPGRLLWDGVVKPAVWLPGLLRYTYAAASFAALGTNTGPLGVRGTSRLVIAVNLLYEGALAGLLVSLVALGNPWLLGLVPAGLLAGISALYALLPERCYLRAVVKPTVPLRWLLSLRMAYLTLLFTTLAWLTYLTGMPWGLYYLVLWAAPMVTVLSSIMIVRELTHHGNGGQDRWDNTRVLRVNGLFEFAVFPLNLDYHLTHHLFPQVPHYRLPQLHALLMETEEYRRQAPVAEGLLWSREGAAHPTTLGLLTTDRAAV